MAENQTLRIVLLGKTGSGKSSLGNVIFGKEHDKGPFETACASVSVTSKCKSDKKVINGKTIQLIDTLGFFDTKKSKKETKAEVLKSLQECAPGPHAFLLVFKVERFTEQEQEVVKKMLKCFSEKAFKYTTVIFTHGDQLDKGTKIEDWANENKDLRILLQKCGGRVHVFDNRYRNNQDQVTKLLKTIEETVEKNGGYYTNSFWLWIKSIKIIGVPLHVVLGLMMGGVVFGAAGAGVAAAVVISKEGVLVAGVMSGLVGAPLGARAVMELDPEAAEDVSEAASGALKALGFGDKSKQS